VREHDDLHIQGGELLQGAIVAVIADEKNSLKMYSPSQAPPPPLRGSGAFFSGM
jgi:hypothetical protein